MSSGRTGPADDGRFWPLGYSSAWVELGIVTEEDIERDAIAWRGGEDVHAEHYRWRAFFQFMRTRTSLPVPLARALYELGAADADVVTGGSIMSVILRRPDCPADLLLAALRSERSYLREIGARRVSEAADGG